MAVSPEDLTPSLPANDPLQKHLNIARGFNRRNFLAGIGMGGAALATAGLMSGCGSDGTIAASAATTETDVLNFALNLEYFEATFYSYVVTGGDIPSASTGSSGTITSPPAKVTAGGGITSQMVDLLAEIYYDELQHVNDLRTLLGSAAVARPNLSFSLVTNTSLYLPVARLAEDLGVTAYAGAATLLTSDRLQAAAQILAVEGFHAGALRYLLATNTALNVAVPANLKPADNYDVPPADPGAGVATAGPTTANGGFFATAGASGSTTAQTNTFPGFAYRRTTSQVLAAVYGSTTAGTASGGFFPAGFNGNIKTV